MSDELNDEATEAYLSGRAQDEPLGQLLASIADRYASIPPPAPGPELAAMMSDSPIDSGVVDRSIIRRRRKRVVAAALTGTALGKVVIGVSVAAASVAGIQASGIVHVPGLPTPHRDVLRSGAPASATTTTSASTTTTEPAIDPDFTRQVEARDAGAVTVAVVDDEFLWIRPVAAAGWTHTLEEQPTAALVTFQGASGIVSVDATIEGGLLHVVVVDQRDGSSDEFWFDRNGRPTDDPTRPVEPIDAPAPPVPPTTAPVDDHHEIDDDRDEIDDDRDEVDTVDDHHEIDDDRDEVDTVDDHHEIDVDDHDEVDTDRHDEDDDESDDDRERSWSDDGTSEAPLVDADDGRDDDRDDHDD